MLRSARLIHAHRLPKASRSSNTYARTLSTTRAVGNTEKTSLAPQTTPTPTPTPSPGDDGHPKISAVPFHFGQQDADARLKIAALLATATIPNLIYATILRFLPPLPESVQNFLREFGIGGNTVKHVATRAVLWPIWRFSFLAEAGAKQIEGSGRRGKVWFAVKEGSVPGHSFAPLSLLPFSTQQLPDTLPPYTPALDLTQLGPETPIRAIPFASYTPADVLERLRRAELGRIVEWHGLRIDLERDLDVQMLAAYPIYFPLYIGEFEFDPNETDGKRTRRVTVVMDAHDENADDCRLAVPRPYGGPTTDSPTYYINSPTFISDATFQLSPQTMYNRSLSGSLATALSEAFGHWLNPPAIPPYGAESENGRVDRTAAFSPPQSPLVRVEEEARGIDWDDVRVQRWSGTEREENERWIDAGQVRFAMRAQLETMKTLESQSGTSQITTIKLGRAASAKGRTSILPSIEKVSMDEAIAQAADDVRKSTEEWEEKRPSWLKAFEAGKEAKSE
ncbi:hypothetical protein NCC49_003327 [Naganishia albida]|nr:hypothetical protein NCC49_003327 [Naganishia albida]